MTMSCEMGLRVWMVGGVDSRQVRPSKPGN